MARLKSTHGNVESKIRHLSVALKERMFLGDELQELRVNKEKSGARNKAHNSELKFQHTRSDTNLRFLRWQNLYELFFNK